MSIIDLLERGRRSSSGAPAVVAGERTIGYDELIAAVKSVANGLRARGLGRGDRIAVLSPNDPAALIASYGAMAAGATYVPISAANGAPDIRSTLTRFDCAALIYHRSLQPLIDTFHDELAQTVRFVRIDTGTDGDADADTSSGGADESLDELRESAGPEPLPAPRLPDIAWLGLTGGTTGLPKGVQISWTAMNAFVQKFVGELTTTRPRLLVATPLTHGAGMLAMAVFARGGTLVVARGLVVPQYLSLLEQQQITQAFLPPTGIYKLLDHPEVHQHDYSALKNLFYGAAPISVPRLRQAIDAFGPVLTQVYGLTECHTMITVMRPEDHFVNADITGAVADDERLSGCGWPSIGTLIEIRDENGTSVPAPQLGEICVSSDLNMSGYYNAPEETAKTLRDGFVHTGDVGYLDPEGCLHIVDRKKDMVITGGFNVYPAEIEPLLRRRPEIADCAVVGIPDDYWGETLVAAVQLTPGTKLDAAAVLTDVRSALGPIKTPKHLLLFDELPHSSLGKVLKTELRNAIEKELATSGSATKSSQPASATERR